MPTLAPPSTSRPWERPTDSRPGAPLLHPTRPFLPRPNSGERAEPFICGFILPTGVLASLSLSFHLSEMGVLFPCPPTSQGGEGLMR